MLTLPMSLRKYLRTRGEATMFLNVLIEFVVMMLSYLILLALVEAHVLYSIIMLICDRILENRPSCHISHFEKYRF